MTAAYPTSTQGRMRRKKRSLLSPINQRRWTNFKKNRRGYWALWIFAALFFATLGAEFVANDRPLYISHQGQSFFPVLFDYGEEDFSEDGFLPFMDYRSDFFREVTNENTTIIWPPIRYSYGTTNSDIPESAPTKPSWMYDTAELCATYPLGVDDPQCTAWNWNWLGTEARTWPECGKSQTSRGERRDPRRRKEGILS